MRLTYILIGGFLLFSLYRRVRRAVGFQRIVPTQMWVRIAMFAIICGLILQSDAARPLSIVIAAVTLCAGAALARLAMRTTALEQRDGHWYYRPHPWIGLVLLALFLGRLVFQIAQEYALHATSGHGLPASFFTPNWKGYSGDPVTAGIYFLLAAYYGVYYISLLRGGAATGRARETAT